MLNDTRNCFDYYPAITRDILKIIFSFLGLDKKDLINCQFVCKKFYNSINETVDWKEFDYAPLHHAITRGYKSVVSRIVLSTTFKPTEAQLKKIIQTCAHSQYREAICIALTTVPVTNYVTSNQEVFAPFVTGSGVALSCALENNLLLDNQYRFRLLSDTMATIYFEQYKLLLGFEFPDTIRTTDITALLNNMIQIGLEGHFGYFLKTKKDSPSFNLADFDHLLVQAVASNKKSFVKTISDLKRSKVKVDPRFVIDICREGYMDVLESLFDSNLIKLCSPEEQRNLVAIDRSDILERFLVNGIIQTSTKTLILDVCQLRAINILKFIFTEGCKIQQVHKQLALQESCKFGTVDMIDFLIHTVGATLDTNSFIAAFDRSNLEVVSYILNRPIEESNIDINTMDSHAIYFACTTGNVKLTDMLLKRQELKITEKAWKSAIEHNAPEVIESILRTGKVCAQSAFEYACELGMYHISELILAIDSRVSASSNDNKALYRAIEQKDIPTLDVIIKNRTFNLSHKEKVNLILHTDNRELATILCQTLSITDYSEQIQQHMSKLSRTNMNKRKATSAKVNHTNKIACL